MITRWLVAAAVAALSTAAAAPSARAQQWAIDLHGGRIRSSIDPSADASQSVVTGIGYTDPAAAFRISAGLPAESHAPTWAALSAYRRLAAHRGGFTTGVDVTGDGLLFHESSSSTTFGGGLLGRVPQTTRTTATGHALSASALPLAAYARGAVQLQARAGMAYYTAGIQQQSASRTMGLGDVQLTWRATPHLALAPVVRAFKGQSEPSATFAGMEAVLGQGPASLWASAGAWSGATDTASAARAAWGLGGSLRLSGRATVDASVRHDGFDPLSLAPAQTSWSMGLSLALGAHREAPRAPVPAAYHDGKATIRLAGPSAGTTGTPLVAGDFNDWTPAPMQRDDGGWIYTVALKPGVYDYAFVAPNGDWFVPEGTPGRKDDGMGGHVAVLVVR